MINSTHHKNQAASNRRVTLEGGSTSAQITTEKTRFSKQAAEVTDGHIVQESVTLASPSSEVEIYSPQNFQNGNTSTGRVRFSNLSSQDRSDARRILKDLDKKARLFARDENDQLVRISPGTGKELLDKGQAVEIVRRLGRETSNKSSSSSTHNYQQHILVPDDHYRSSNSQSSGSVKVEYSSSPITDWESVLWHDDEDFKGVPGTPKLPSSGEPVTISTEWESKWAKSSAEHDGIFRVRSKHNSSSGYQRGSEVAEG